MSELCHFSTIEDFWKYYNHLPKPSDVFFDGDCKKKIGPDERIVEEYSLFKKGIEPEWGDPRNVVGGEWFCRQNFDPDTLDLFWQNLVLGVIGEVIEDAVDAEKKYSDYINGCRVLDRSRTTAPLYKLELWVSTRDETIKDRLKAKLLEIVTDGASRKASIPKFEWKDHS